MGARFTQADITRALKGAAAAGLTVALEITLDGAIRLIPVEARPVAASGEDIMKRIGKFR
jgi:hypothetical protein